MFKKIIFSMMIALLVAGRSYAGDLSDNEQNEFYKNCSSTCYRNQLSSKENESVLSTPFILETYCNCYCFKVATRSSRLEYNMMAKFAVTGALDQIKQLEIVKRSSQACLRMLVDD